MKKELLKKGNFYKAAMHVHTNISDGSESIKTVKKAYKDKGYSVVAFTDHEVFVTHNDLTEPDFLAINATEISVNDSSFDKGGWPYLPTYHINFYAKSKDTDYLSACTEDSIYVKHSHNFMTERMKQNKFEKVYTTECINKLIKAGVNDGFLVSYNHPRGSLQNYKNYIDLENLWGVECYNYGSSICGMDESALPLEDLLNVGKKVFPLVGDDSHDLESIGHCFTMISAEELNYESIINALTNGDFYSSTGPEIHSITIENGILNIECTNADSITVLTERRVSFVKKNACCATFDLNNYIKDSNIFDGHFNKAYFRIEVKNGTDVAYSRPYFLG